ncbi:MAG TPA: endonuclease/exonuclease/phosphatase family protein [Gammaproteobacteria bacterium]
MNVAAGIFIVIDLLAAIVTLLPLLPAQSWWSRAGEFPRLQIASAMAILLLAQAVVLPAGYWPLHLVLFTCLVYQLVWIAPYTPFFPCEVMNASEPGDDGRRISVLVANVLMSNRDDERLRDLIAERDPDLVLLLETDRWWQGRMQYLRETHPHGLDCPLDNRYGMQLYSRLALENPSLEFLVDEDVPSMHAGVRLPSGDCVRFHALHPTPPSPTENPTSRERDAEVLVIGRAVSEDRCRVIVTGDFNDVAWSPTTRLFRKISRLLDPRVGRGMFNTFHAHMPLLRWPLDHVFHSDDFTLVDIDVLPRFGSDHLPIWYRLQYEPSADAMQDAPEASADDHAEASEKIRKTSARPEDVPDPEAD